MERCGMDFKKVVIPEGGKLFKIHNFTFMFKGTNYNLEIDEYNDGTCTGHGEHSTDKSSVLESVSGKSIEECLNALIKKIKR